MQKFLESESSAFIPFAVTWHILFCKKCRTEIFALRDKFKELKNGAAYTVPVDLTESIMYKINLLEVQYEHNVSNFKWILVGTVIFSSLMLFTFSDSFMSLKPFFGRVLEVPISIVMGVGITIYASLFIGSHLEYLKQVNYIKRFLYHKK
jgi:hypothetical protein